MVHAGEQYEWLYFDTLGLPLSGLFTHTLWERPWAQGLSLKHPCRKPEALGHENFVVVQ